MTCGWICISVSRFGPRYIEVNLHAIHIKIEPTKAYSNHWSESNGLYC